MNLLIFLFFSVIALTGSRSETTLNTTHLQSVVTPVKVGHFVELLSIADYDPQKIQFLKDGFTNGFDIGYEGPEHRQSTSDNIPFTVGDEVQMWNKLMKEVKLKRVAGPYKTIPFKDFIQSPIGLVPKAGSEQTRLIFHLFYQFKNDGLPSLNACTLKEKCTVRYSDLDYAVNTYLQLCDELMVEHENDQEQLSSSTSISRTDLKARWKRSFCHHKRCKNVIYSGKSDLKSAFRI